MKSICGKRLNVLTDSFMAGITQWLVMNWFERGKTFDECEKYIGDTI